MKKAGAPIAFYGNPPGEFNTGAEKLDYNLETKMVQIVATSAEHAVFFGRHITPITFP